MRISEIPLEELYKRPSMTTNVEAAIRAKEDFSKISPTYCEKVCKLKCKGPEKVQLLSTEVDVLIIQDHKMPRGKFDKTDTQSESIQTEIIQFIAKKVDFSGLTYRLTNVLKCAPNDRDFPNGKAPIVTTLRKCEPYLLAEIETVKPKVILCMGTAAAKALIGAKYSTKNRGEVHNYKGIPVVVSLHPRVLSMIRQNASGAMWGGDYFAVIERDFTKAKNIALKTLTVPDLKTSVMWYRDNRIKFAKSIEDVAKFTNIINNLPETSIISFDTETTGLDPLAEDAKLLTIQFGYRDPEDKQVKALVIPLWHRENKMYNADKAWELIAPVLNGKRGKVAHNGKFDILYIYWTTGVRVSNLKLDTMLALHTIDSGASGTFGLKVAAWDWIPETGLGGYEDLLPPLTKSAKSKSEDEEEPIESE